MNSMHSTVIVALSRSISISRAARVQPVAQARRARRGHCVVVLALLLAGCGGGEGGSGFGQGGSAKTKNPPQSNESVFTKRPGAGSKSMGLAYQDGFTAGRNSATDFNMNWMLHWDKDDAWRAEYDRGWKEGRNLRKLQDQRNKNAGANPS